MQIRSGFDAKDQRRAAELYWDAFGGKLGRVLGPRTKALAFFERVMRADHAISAYSEDGTLLGIAGFKTPKGALADGSFRDMRAIYGLWGASWRVGLIALLERDVENKSFLMDGIFVSGEARGQGVGTQLLDAVRREAKRRGYRSVRLDVIDTNPRAKALYLRNGFVEKGTQELGPLRHIFGFKSAARMVAPVKPEANLAKSEPSGLE